MVRKDWKRENENVFFNKKKNTSLIMQVGSNTLFIWNWNTDKRTESHPAPDRKSLEKFVQKYMELH